HKTVVITGGAGFIGSNLALHLQNSYKNCKIVVFDSFVSDAKFPNGNYTSLGHFKNLLGFSGEVISGDINNKQDLKRLESIDFDVMFHQAAISDTTVMDQKLMLATNVNAFKDLLELCVQKDATMVYASSAGTYGNSPAPNKVGEGELPQNVYGFSKLMMDNIAYEYMEKTDISIVGLRYFNVYGPKEVYKGKTASMILQLGLQMLEGKTPRLFKWGEQKRDFVYIDDVVEANIKAAGKGISGVYNVGSGKARMFKDIVGGLNSTLDMDREIEFFDNPYSFYQNHTEADITQTKQDLGYEPRFDLEEGIDAYGKEIIRIYEKGEFYDRA
ncbi:MAG: ADP-glyceromanno-heptose 6-epimerase, partial [Campylobacterota bacterium]